MASTTLMTFRLQAPHSIYNVNLLGSWDNFSKPYPMQKDPRTGSGHWRGCHSFTNIVCDGDAVKPADGRDGGLKMGGTYWYYYQLNGDIEHHNAAEPWTTSCPFLPGQIVNILEVPIQVQDVTHGRCGSASSLGSVHYTLNPEDKYLGLRPPVAPRIRDSKVSVQAAWDSATVQKQQDIDTGTLLQASCPTVTVKYRRTQSQSHLIQLASGGRRLCTSPWLSSNRTTSSLKIRRIRQTQSARTMGPATTDNDRPISRAGTRNELTSSAFQSDSTFWASELPSRWESVIDDIDDTKQSFGDRTSASVCGNLHAQLANDPVMEPQCVLPTPKRSSEALNALVCRDYDADCTPTNDRLWPFHMAAADPFTYSEPDYRLSLDDSESADPTGIIVNLYAEVDDIVRSEEHHAESASFSAGTSELFSPSLTSSTAYSGYMSPLHMGQPNTPETTEFEESFLSLDHDTPLPRNTSSKVQIDDVCPDRAYLGSVGFGGYNLVEHASALTIRSSAPNNAKTAVAATTYKAASSRDRVTSWNDGSPALEDLFNELSYLGEIIS
ncbi:hypothetical protein MMC18_008367 [Xylographa bjoerkii]|nr:hypothetical protein [Xylographa bjoerkii]